MIDPTERWLPVPGWESFYEVSDLGRVRSLPRVTASGIRGGQLLRPVPKNRHGHLRVSLTRAGERMYRDVHWLVTRAFLGPCPDGQEARHGAGRTSDNRLVNLSYGTRAENSRDKVRDGVDARGERSAAAKLTWNAVRDIRRRYAAGESRRALALTFGVSVPNIGRITRGETWRE